MGPRKPIGPYNGPPKDYGPLMGPLKSLGPEVIVPPASPSRRPCRYYTTVNTALKNVFWRLEVLPFLLVLLIMIITGTSPQ